MKILIHLNESFQIVSWENTAFNEPYNDANQLAVGIFDKVSGQITTVVGKLVHQTIATTEDAFAKRILAKTNDTFAFLTIATRLIQSDSSNDKLIALSIETEGNDKEGDLNQFFKENLHFKPLKADTKQDLWGFLAEAEVAEVEEMDWGHHQRKINERLESLLREAEKQGVEWIRTMNDLTVSMAKLKESEQTKKALLEAVPDAMFQVDKDGYYLEYIPAKGESAIPAAAFIGNNMKDLLPEEYAKEAVDILQSALQNSKVEAYSFEWELEEGLRYYELRFSPINESEALCMMRDITEGKRGEELLRKSVMYYQDLIKRSPAPMMVLDKETRFVDINAAAMDLLGILDQRQLSNRRAYDFVHKQDKSLVKDRFKRGFKDNLPEGIAMYRAIKLNGEEMDIEVAATMMNLGGKRVAQVILREVK